MAAVTTRIGAVPEWGESGLVRSHTEIAVADLAAGNGLAQDARRHRRKLDPMVAIGGYRHDW
jgi:hypothetical protein